MKGHILNMRDAIVKNLEEHIITINFVKNNLMDEIIKAINLVTFSLKKGGTVFFTGNGGSAADSQHLAGELVSRFLYERKALPAIALTTDTSILTAIGNDYGYDHVFVRQIEALVKPDDIIFFISTSGNSSNQIAGVIKAKEIGAKTVGLLGKDGGKLGKLVDLNITIPGKLTPRIQEAHIAIGHIICEFVEKEFIS